MRPTAERIERMAAACGLPVTDFSAALLEVGLRHLEELPKGFHPEEVLPETA